MRRWYGCSAPVADAHLRTRMTDAMIERNRAEASLNRMEAALDVGVTRLELVEAAAAGDRDAFGRLVEPLLGSSLGVARIIAGSDSDGDDAMQDALLSAWQGVGTLRHPGAFPAWLRRHVVRAAMRHARRRP